MRASMSSCEERLEIRLLQQAQTAIRKLLEQKDGRQDLSLSEMEDLVNDIPAQDARICQDCGAKLRYKGQKTKRVETLRGEVEVERGYYHCASCGRGYFPPR